MIVKTDSLIDFIGIGAQKAGSAWLFRRLEELPDFSLPYEKEFHYFDKGKVYRKLGHKKDLSLLLYNALKLKVKKIGRVWNAIEGNSLDEFKWRIKYNFFMNNDDAYLSLFKNLEGIKGEITPDYSALLEGDIKRMHDLLPGLKIVFIIRNPIGRAWSHYKSFNRFQKNKLKNIGEIDEDEIIGFMKSDYQVLRSDYFRILELYAKYYSKNQIIIGFFDAIKEQPLDLLREIVKFLGGDTINVEKYCELGAENNVSPKIDMPLKVKKALKEMYFPMIEKSAELFNGYCSSWLEDLNNNNNNNSSLHSSTFFLS